MNFDCTSEEFIASLEAHKWRIRKRKDEYINEISRLISQSARKLSKILKIHKIYKKNLNINHLALVDETEIRWKLKFQIMILRYKKHLKELQEDRKKRKEDFLRYIKWINRRIAQLQSHPWGSLESIKNILILQSMVAQEEETSKENQKHIKEMKEKEKNCFYQ